MRLILIGAPGSGKGTQAAFLVQAFALVHISSGSLFRQALADGNSDLHYYLSQGLLVPDSVTIPIVKSKLLALDNFILDGFPRTVQQAEALSAFTDIDIAINISVPEEILVERITGRRICKACGETYHLKNKPSSLGNKCEKCGGELYQRSDDNIETLKSRLKVYREETLPVIEYYKKSGKYAEVEGNLPVEKVQERLLEVVNKMRGGLNVEK